MSKAVVLASSAVSTASTLRADTSTVDVELVGAISTFEELASGKSNVPEKAVVSPSRIVSVIVSGVAGITGSVDVAIGGVEVASSGVDVASACVKAGLITMIKRTSKPNEPKPNHEL